MIDLPLFDRIQSNLRHHPASREVSGEHRESVHATQVVKGVAIQSETRPESRRGAFE